MNVVKDELIIKQEQVPFEFIEVSCEVEIGYQDDESSSSILDSNGLLTGTQSDTTLSSEGGDIALEKNICFDGEDERLDTSELYNGVGIEQGNKKSMLLLRDKLKKLVNGRSITKMGELKNKHSLITEIELENKQVLPAIKEEVVDIPVLQGISNTNDFSINRIADNKSATHVQSSEGILSRCSDSNRPTFHLGPNDSFATIRSIATCDNSEPIVVVVRNVDSDKPICEPVHVPSARNLSSKLLFEIHKFENLKNNQMKQNNFIESESQVEQTSSNIFPRICLTETMSFQCVVCNLECSNRKALIEHVKSHSTDKKSFECPTCKKIFTQQCNLKRHMRCHSGERPFSCPYCKKLFADQGYLTTHLRYHTNTKPYTCEHCEKAFFDRSNYVKHLKSHSGEKPYPCSICKKSFLQQSDLTRHTRVHSGERPFKCNYCERSFTQHGDLTTHLRHHTGERPFVCSDCQKTFANKRYLNSHVKGRICFKKKGNRNITSALKETKLIPITTEMSLVKKRLNP